MTALLAGPSSGAGSGRTRLVTGLREAPRPYRLPGLRERELSRLWELQQLPPESLVTTDGRELRVVFRGRRGTGPGPDFRDAVIAFDGTVLQGDVELHLRSSDFFRHGHGTDQAYRRLQLHVVYHDDAPVRLEGGRLLPAVALERWVDRRAGVLRAALAGPAAYREPCHDGIAGMGTTAALEVLARLGEGRLRRRGLALAAGGARRPAEETLFAAVARALGLTRNAGAMEQLAAALPLDDLRALAARSGDPGLALRGVLLGAAGLLDGQLELWPPDGDAGLIAAWRTAGAPIAAGIAWAPGPYRAGGSPRERICGLAHLLDRAGPPFSGTLADWRTLLSAGPAPLIACLQAPRWIGRDRAIEIAINAVLPWLLAAYGDRLEPAVLALFAALPAPQPYGVNGVVLQALAGSAERPPARTAAVSQGALQMTRDWCTQGGCGRCPLSPTTEGAIS